MSVADFITRYRAKELPKRYRGLFAASQSNIPDPSYYVHVDTGFVNSKPVFPKKLSGSVYQFFSGWYFRKQKPYKAEKIIKGKRKIVWETPKPVERVTIERTKIGMVREGKYFYFDPKKIMDATAKERLFRSLSKEFNIRYKSVKGSDEIFTVIALLFWMFAGV